jgi:hypothetical protein
LPRRPVRARARRARRIAAAREPQNSCATVWCPLTLPEVGASLLCRRKRRRQRNGFNDTRAATHCVERLGLTPSGLRQPVAAGSSGRGGCLLRAARCKHSEHSESASLRRSGRNSVRAAARHRHLSQSPQPSPPRHGVRPRPGCHPGALGQPHGDTTRPPAASFFTGPLRGLGARSGPPFPGRRRGRRARPGQVHFPARPCGGCRSWWPFGPPGQAGAPDKGPSAASASACARWQGPFCHARPSACPKLGIEASGR